MSTLEKMEETASSPSEEETGTIVEDKTEENAEDKDDSDRGIKSINNYSNYSIHPTSNKWNFI